jgi:O-6-methylguanine DNA methyltransferase
MKNKPQRSSSKAKVEHSAFAQKVRAIVAKIPKGQVMTYAAVAKKAGNPGAARAVGSLMAKNYDPKIPCHRVIRTDGKIGNYNRGGEKAKRALLKKEGAIM